MRIALIAHNLTVAGGMSVGKNIIKTMPEIAPMHDYLMVVPEKCEYPSFENVANVDVLECPKMPLWKRHFWENNVLRRRLKQFRPDWTWGLGNLGFGNDQSRRSILFHNPYWVYPAINTAQLSMNLGEWLRINSMACFSVRRLRRDLTHTDSVYCQTEIMRRRLSDCFDYPLEKIGFCPNAISGKIDRESDSMPPQLIPYKKRFKLFVLTRYYPHKNLERIVDMYDTYREDLSDTLCILTIAPHHGIRAKELLDAIRNRNLDSLILCVGEIPQEQISCYFNNVQSLFLPTLLESFSGTYLEAMLFHCPIVTSDMDFAREICRNAALYVDPHSLESMKNGILKIKSDDRLRQRLVEAGDERQVHYVQSWSMILKNVLDREGVEHL